VRAAFSPSPSSSRAARLATLTGREAEVLQRLAEGQGTAAMAASMHVSVTTVRTHVRSLMSKLGVHSRLEAAALFAEERRRPA
jgi:two-component system, NarL family, nitrate/nitrite response regulator NarL